MRGAVGDLAVTGSARPGEAPSASVGQEGASRAAPQPPYRVNLKPAEGSTVRYFLLDHDGTAYRVAWYQQRRRPCPDCDGQGFAAVGLCKGCGGKGWHMPVVRTPARHPELHWAIAVARGEVKPGRGRDGQPQGSPSLDSVMLADYVWSTPWGSRLPDARRWHPIDCRWTTGPVPEAIRVL